MYCNCSLWMLEHAHDMPTAKPMMVRFFFALLLEMLAVVFAHFVCRMEVQEEKTKMSHSIWCNSDTTKVKWTWRYKCDRQSRTWSIKTNLEIYSFSQFHAFHSIYLIFIILTNMSSFRTLHKLPSIAFFVSLENNICTLYLDIPEWTNNIWTADMSTQKQTKNKKMKKIEKCSQLA